MAREIGATAYSVNRRSAGRAGLPASGGSGQKIKKDKRRFLGFGHMVKPEELVGFIQQFASMYEAGISILQCLDALGRQTRNVRFKKVIQGISLDIQGGTSLSEALSKYPEVFSPFFVNMVIAGEKGGIIDKILDRLALHIEKMQDLRRKIQGAFAYPAVVGFLSMLVVTFLLIVIIPVFQNIYEGLHLKLPLPTRILILLSLILRKFGWVLALLTGAAIFLFYRYKDIKPVRRRIDRIKITMPLFGEINKKAAVSRFIRTFGDMLDSGVPLPEAINTSKEVAGNMVVAEVVQEMHNSISRGNTLAEALEEQELIPPTAVQMIAAGEASGKLPAMLTKTTTAIDRDLDLAIKRLLVSVEPVLTFVMACVVAFIALSIYLPMFDLMSQIQGGQ